MNRTLDAALLRIWWAISHDKPSYGKEDLGAHGKFKLCLEAQGYLDSSRVQHRNNLTSSIYFLSPLTRI